MHIPQTEVILRHDEAELARVTLPPGEYVIGRDDGVEIFADTPLISRRHAQLTINYDHLLIEDLGSSNGTFVAEQRIGECTRLYPNQAVRLGDVTVELRRERAPSEPGVSLAPVQDAVRRVLPEEVLTHKRYAIGQQVARGGMGAILAAQQQALRRPVAMKVMLGSAEPGDALRFVEEAQVTGQLAHPNIVPVYELGVDEQDQLFYTMKMVRGITLKKIIELLAQGVEATVKKYPLPALLTIFQKACDAIAFAHANGILHRDLKPENIMLGDFGEVLVMDWGLAKVLGGHRAVDAGTDGAVPSSPHRSMVTTARMLEPGDGTQAGAILGTPQYMAPEQARGEIEWLDARADIYSLGAILFHLLFLRPAIGGGDAMQIVDKVARGEIEWPTPKELRAVPDSLLAVCRQALALDPAARYRSVEDLQADVLAYQSGFATRAEQAGAWKQVALFVRRNKAASIGVAAVLLVGTTLGTQAILAGQRAAREAAAAKATLADLRRTAPVFYEQAKVVFDEGKFDEAMEKIGYAIQLDDQQPDYHLFRANLLESSQKLADAAEGYRRVLALRPANATAKINLALCEKLLLESGGGPLQRAQQNQLLTALREQKRLVEAAPLGKIIDPDIALVRATLLARLREARKQPGWDDRYSLVNLPDGTFKVNLSKMAPIDLSVLRGQPVTEMNLEFTGVADLSGLAGLPLRDLNLGSAKATDLSPLRGMPLQKLNLSSGPATDLSPLRGMPLESLSLRAALATDLSPLRGMKLRSLILWRSPVEDLSPLAGMPLTDLDCYNCYNIVDFTPLRGLPLQRLDLTDTKLKDFSLLSTLTHLEELNLTSVPIADLAPLEKLPLTVLYCYRTKVTSIAALRGKPLRFLNLGETGVTDLSPLADCTTLEELVLPPAAEKIEFLRKLPRLKRLSKQNGSYLRPFQTAEEFWREYDAK